MSGGFAFVHPDSSTDVCAVEAVKVSDLDPAAVAAGLQEYTAKLAALQGKGGDEYEAAAAQVGWLWVGVRAGVRADKWWNGGGQRLR